MTIMYMGGDTELAFEIPLGRPLESSMNRVDQCSSGVHAGELSTQEDTSNYS